MNYCNCPNCRTNNCPAALHETSLREALDRANKLIESQANENDAIVSKLKAEKEKLEKEIADMLKAELEELTVLQQAKTLLEKMVKEAGDAK